MNAHASLKMKPDRKAKLFAAATHAFTQYGFEQASLNRIIADIGMSKSSFYHYFSNKTDLFQQILKQTLAPFAQYFEAFEPESLTRETFWPEIMAAAQGANALIEGQQGLFEVGRMFHRNLNDKNGVCAEMMAHPLALVTRILEHGKEIGAVRDDLPTSLLIESAMGMGMSIDRWAVENVARYSPAEMGAFSEKIVGLFMRLLAPEE